MKTLAPAETTIQAPFQNATDIFTKEAFTRSRAQQMAKLSGTSYCTDEQLMNWNCGQYCSDLSSFRVTHVAKGLLDAYGFIGYDTSRREIVFSFRGSVSVQNWISNLAILRLDFNFPGVNGATVQAAWYGMANSLWMSMAGPFDELRRTYPSYNVVMTGHSLGGAMADLVGLILYLQRGIIPQLYTFGAPRVGNSVYTNYWASIKGLTQYRLTNSNDPVPGLPPTSLGWHHRPTEVYFTNIIGLSWKVCDASGEDPTCHSSHWLPIPLNVYAHLTYVNIALTCK